MTAPLKLSQAIRVFALPLIDALPNPDDVPALRAALDVSKLPGGGR